jgi:hypothetical protein
MKLRLDLLKFLTSEDILEDAGFDVHRWSAEPVFAKTGVGFLKPATEEDKAEEMARSERLIGRLKERAAREAASLDSSEL